jgi:hypothetical protein
MERIFFIGTNFDVEKTKMIMKEFEENKKVKIDDDIMERIKSKIDSVSVNEKLTLKTMKEFYQKFGYVLDPRIVYFNFRFFCWGCWGLFKKIK